MNWNQIGRKLFFPHPVIAALLVPLAALGLIYAFALPQTDLLRFPLYVFSFYVLVVLCLRLPRLMAAVQRFRRENRYYRRYAADVQLRMNISLFGTFLYNGAYAAFQLILGLYHHSPWFYAMAGYYFLLAGMRLMLGRHLRAHTPGEEKRTEWQKYRLCGGGLALMNGALIIFVLYFVRHLRMVHHHPITVIAMATYTFGALTLAIVNVIRYRRYHSPACSAAKALSLASASVSMLSLENAMLTTFGKGDQQLFQQIMLGASGAAVSLLMMGMAGYMILHAYQELQRLKKME